MITWIRDLIFGKNYGKAEPTVNPQITDAVTQNAAPAKTTKKKTVTKKTTAPKTTKKPPVKKTTNRKTK